MTYRPHQPLRAVIAACIRAAGGSIRCAETDTPMTSADALAGQVQIDHAPPLALRKFDEETRTYQPDANDPEYLDLISAEGHSLRTNKRRGHQRGDQTQIAHIGHLSDAHAAHKAVITAKGVGERPDKPLGRIPSRPFATNRNRRLRKPLRGPAERRT